jgi:DNA-binding NarL/FixJ family response regulator
VQPILRSFGEFIVDQTTIKVVIADEHYLFRQGIKALLSSVAEVQVVDEAATAAEALLLAETHSADLLMLDAALSDPHFDLVKRMKERRPQTQVLLVGNSEESSRDERASEAGAAGWLARDWAAPDIIKAICKTVPQQPAKRIIRSTSGLQAEVTLTRREQEVLQLLMAGSSSRDIATTLSLSIKTIEAHRFNLMRKLDVHNRSELIKVGIRNQISGYMRGAEMPEPAEVL